jgi:hypothetical protein
MTEIISCPGCRRKLQVPETLLGQDVQCPSCSRTFVAATGSIQVAPPRPEEPAPAWEGAPGERRQAAEGPGRPPPDDYGRDDYGAGEAYRRRRRHPMVPHRGSAVLTLGILSLIVCGPILGPMAWAMGQQDLAEIRAGRMDPEGEGPTNAGRICGIIATVLGVVLLCLGGLAFLAEMSNPRHF